MTIDQRVEFLMQSIESHDRQIGELTGQIGELKDSIATLRPRNQRGLYRDPHPGPGSRGPRATHRGHRTTRQPDPMTAPKAASRSAQLGSSTFFFAAIRS
jgi:hypothetical protein